MLSFNWRIFFMCSFCAMRELGFFQCPYLWTWLTSNSFHYLIVRHFLLSLCYLSGCFLILLEYFWTILNKWRMGLRFWTCLKYFVKMNRCLSRNPTWVLSVILAVVLGACVCVLISCDCLSHFRLAFSRIEPNSFGLLTMWFCICCS